MITTGHALGIVAAIALVSAALRFFPSLVFRGKETPKSIIYLGDVLPYAIMGMLLVYCLKATPILASPHGLPELIAVLVTVLLQLWKRNSLLSMVVGTIVYMLLLQLVF